MRRPRVVFEVEDVDDLVALVELHSSFERIEAGRQALLAGARRRRSWCAPEEGDQAVRRAGIGGYGDLRREPSRSDLGVMVARLASRAARATSSGQGGRLAGGDGQDFDTRVGTRGGGRGRSVATPHLLGVGPAAVRSTARGTRR